MGITWLRGNALTLLENGTEFFPALETAIDGATTEIFLETYIFAHDDTGHRIAAALPGRRPGVTVRLLVDGFGGRDFVAT
jgi:cardiolipin synthase